MLNSVRNVVVLGSPYDAAADALFARFTTPPTDARKALINTLIVTLKAATIWDKIDAMYMLASADSQAALLNWKSANYNAIAVNSPTFQADKGYTGDGATSRLRTQFTPSTNGVNFLQDNCGLWVYCLTDVTGGQADLGANSAPQAQVQSRRTSNALGIALSDNTLTAPTSIATSVGLSGASRAVSTARKAWRNGSQIGADSSVTSTGISAAEQWICASNAGLFSTRQVAFAAWTSALTGLETALYNAVLAYLQGVGAQ